MTICKTKIIIKKLKIYGRAIECRCKKYFLFCIFNIRTIPRVQEWLKKIEYIIQKARKVMEKNSPNYPGSVNKVLLDCLYHTLSI